MDLAIVAQSYGSSLGTPKWNEACDINNDGKVSLADFVTVTVYYGMTCP